MGKKKISYEQKKWETMDINKNDYVRIARDLMSSSAYTNLTPAARVVYHTLKSEYKGYYTDMKVKPDSVICPYTTIQRNTKLTSSTISKSIKELELFGFIHVENGGLLRVPNIYRFTAKWQEVDDEKAIAFRRQHKLETKRSGVFPTSSVN